MQESRKTDFIALYSDNLYITPTNESKNITNSPTKNIFFS